MMELLKVERPLVDWAVYCAMPVADQIMWEEKGDTVTKSMLFLMNSKTDNTK